MSLVGVVPEDENLTAILAVEKPLIGAVMATPQISGSMMVSTKDVPFYETANDFGGETVYIAREVINNGSE